VPAGGRVRFSIRHTDSGLGYWLPSDGEVTGNGELSGSTEVDVSAAALGERLSDGVWQLAVGIHGSDPVWSEHVPVPATAVSGGIVNGILVARSAVGGSFALDVGATRSSVIPKPGPQDLTIEDSAAGTLLTARLDDLPVHGESRVPGHLLLDKFRLRATLVAADQHARVDCFLSGLAGTAAISTRFGAGPPAPIGLSLEISPVGIMRVVPAVSATPKPAARGVAKVPTSAHPAGTPVIVRLRHRLPRWLDPLVRALARSKLAGRGYRKLAGRS